MRKLTGRCLRIWLMIFPPGSAISEWPAIGSLFWSPVLVKMATSKC